MNSKKKEGIEEHRLIAPRLKQYKSMYRHPSTALANLRLEISPLSTSICDIYGCIRDSTEASLFGRGPLSRSFFSRVKMHPPAGEVSRRRQPSPRNLAPGHGPSDNSVLVSHYNTTRTGLAPVPTGVRPFLLRSPSTPSPSLASPRRNFVSSAKLQPPFFPPKFSFQRGGAFRSSINALLRFLVNLARKNTREFVQIDRY